MATRARQILAEWARRLNAGDLAGVTALYAEKAVLLATFAPDPATTPDGVQAYFERLGGLENLSVTIDEASVQDFESSIAGLYTFAHGPADARVAVASRFTFVVDPDRERPILHHHSSQVPTPS